MKRINQDTGKPFRSGDKREDGYVFYAYDRRYTNDNGCFREAWLKPENLEKRHQYLRDLWAERRELVNQIKMDSGCVDCGYNEHPAALQFDHVVGDKEFNIGCRISSSWERVQKEIDKCVVRRACCHAVRTWDEEFHKGTKKGA